MSLYPCTFFEDNEARRRKGRSTKKGEGEERVLVYERGTEMFNSTQLAPQIAQSPYQAVFPSSQHQPHVPPLP